MMKSREKLSQSDINRVSRRYMFGGQLGWNYERMMNVSYARAVYPALEKIYGKKSPELKKAMKTEMQFFNTSPFLTAFILGLDLSLQEQEGIDSIETVAAVKTSLMGPFAAVGDSLFGAVIPTICGSIAAYMGLEGNPLGVIIWLLIAAGILYLRYFELPIAYKQGQKLLANISGLLQKLTDAATLLGVLVVGGLIPTVIKVITPYQFVMGEKTLILQDDVLNKLLPALIPLLLVWFAYWLLGRKKLDSTKVIWIFLVLSIIFHTTGILAIG
ncbi:TPA: PTS system mannose/fructose/sorbose family transporter subunit IID [Streptococcus suis]